MLAFLDNIEVTAPNIRTFWFKPERTLRYVAGQYLDVNLPHTSADNRGAVRTMSLSSSPTEPLLAITTAFEPRGGSTFKRALLALKPGDAVTVTDPMGDFILPKDPVQALTFVAGGIGIAPVRSMVKWLIDTGEARNIQIIYIARAPEVMTHLKLLESYSGAHITKIYTQNAPAGQQPTSRPTTPALLKLIKNPNDQLIYLSGPQPLMETYWQELQTHDIPRNHLILDYFTGYQTL